MPLIAKNTGGADFEPPPCGMTQAVCAFVEDVGMQVNDIKGGLQHKCVICWELADRMQDQRPFMLSRSYTVSLHEKATLRKDLESWRGKAFTNEELEGFDLEKLIGANCTVNVVEYVKKNGSKGHKIASIGPKMKGLTNISVFNTAPPEWIAKQREQNEQDAANAANAAHQPQQAAAPVQAAPANQGRPQERLATEGRVPLSQPVQPAYLRPAPAAAPADDYDQPPF